MLNRFFSSMQGTYSLDELREKVRATRVDFLQEMTPDLRVFDLMVLGKRGRYIVEGGGHFTVKVSNS